MRLRNLFMILLLCMTVGVFSACTGDDGATGPQGPPGPPGPAGPPGPGVEEGMDNPDDCTIFADRSRALIGSNRDDVMCGNERNNTIRGGEGDDTIFGREGKDNLQGQDDDDILYGGPGDDELNGGADSDELYGEGGMDKLIASGDDDIIDGGEGSDMVVYLGASAGNDMFFSVNLAEGYAEKKARLGTDGTTELSDQSRDALVPSMAERDAEGEILEDLINVENIWGSAQPDALVGDANNNVIGGDAGADYIDGGDGVDTASYAGSAAVTVSLAADPQANTGGHAEGDVLVNIENLLGSDNADSLTGDGKDNVLNGGKGAEVTIVGGGGNDTIIGGEGDDLLLTGNTGADMFVVHKGHGSDTIADFDADEGDKLVLVGFSGAERNDRTTGFSDDGTNGTFTIAGQTITLTGTTDFRESSDVIYRDN